VSSCRAACASRTEEPQKRLGHRKSGTRTASTLTNPRHFSTSILRVVSLSQPCTQRVHARPSVSLPESLSRTATSQRHVFTVYLTILKSPHCPAQFQPHGSSKSHRPANIHTWVGLDFAPAATYAGQRSRQPTCTSVSFNAFRQRGSSLSRHETEGPAGADVMINVDDEVGIIPARQQRMMPMVEMPGRKLSVSFPGMCFGQPATWKASSAHILAAPRARCNQSADRNELESPRDRTSVGVASPGRLVYYLSVWHQAPPYTVSESQLAAYSNEKLL
jgi:hypothetical protein